MTTKAQDRLNRAYSERAALSGAFAKTALQLGWKVGRGIDTKEPDAAWRHVLYVELPDGRQVSWHFAPSDFHLLEGLPTYEGEWDGNFTGRDPSWCLNLLQK